MNKRKALLWEIFEENKTLGYIFGSMHVPTRVLFPDLNCITQYIDACSIFATEIPLDNDTQMQMAAKLHLPPSVTIEYLWGVRKFNKYSKILLKAFDIDLRLFNHLIPIYLINLISQKILFSGDLPLDTPTLDASLWEYAVEQDIQVTGIEDTELHLNVMDSMNFQYQLKALESLCANVPKSNKKYLKLLRLYKQQDIHTLYKYSKRELGEMKEIMLYTRNLLMVDRFIEYTENLNLFAVVGAGHLSGEFGILHTLVERGYIIKPVKLDMHLN